MSIIPQHLIDRAEDEEVYQEVLEGERVDRRRRAVGEKSKPTYLIELKDRHLEILRLVATGMSAVDVAKEMGITPQSVSNVLNSPLAQEKLEEFRQVRTDFVLQANNELDEMLPEAVEAYKDILQKKVNVTPIQRAKIAGELFDRTGLGKVSKIESKSSRITFSGDELAKMRERALARKAGAMPIIVEEEDNAI